MSYVTSVGQGGRIVLPARMREAAGLAVGDRVIVRLRDGRIEVETYDAAIRFAQDLVRKHISPGQSLTDELLAERREEAERE